MAAASRLHVTTHSDLQKLPLLGALKIRLNLRKSPRKKLVVVSVSAWETTEFVFSESPLGLNFATLQTTRNSFDSLLDYSII